MAKLSDLPRIVAEALQSKSILEPAAKELETSIVKRTRLGKGVRENLADNHPLPALKERTVKIRKQLKKQGLLTGPNATPKKSNLSRSGNMLSSVEAKVEPGEIKIELDQVEQRKLNEILEINKDYQFMRVSKAEFKRALKKISDEINKILSRINITDL